MKTDDKGGVSSPTSPPKQLKKSKRLSTESRRSKVDYYKFTLNYNNKQISQILKASPNTVRDDIDVLKADTQQYWRLQASTGFARYIQTTVIKMHQELSTLESIKDGMITKIEKFDPETGHKYYAKAVEKPTEYAYVESVLDNKRKLLARFLAEHGLYAEMEKLEAVNDV